MSIPVSMCAVIEDSSVRNVYSSQYMAVVLLELQALPRLQQLEMINFDDCLLRTAGAKAIAKSLSVATTQLKV